MKDDQTQTQTQTAPPPHAIGVMGTWRKAVSFVKKSGEIQTPDGTVTVAGYCLRRFNKHSARWEQIMHFATLVDLDSFLEFLEDCADKIENESPEEGS